MSAGMRVLRNNIDKKRKERLREENLKRIKEAQKVRQKLEESKSSK